MAGAFTITHFSLSNASSASVTVYTTDQKYALEVPSATQPYMTEYTFTLKA